MAVPIFLVVLDTLVWLEPSLPLSSLRVMMKLSFGRTLSSARPVTAVYSMLVK